MHAASELAGRILDLPRLSAMGDEAARQLVERSSVVELAPGEALFREGDPPGDLYVVLSGGLKVTCRAHSDIEVVVGEAGPGALVGEMSLLDRATRSASAHAAEPTALLQIDAGHFVELVNTAHPAAWVLLRAVREQLVQRLRSVDERVDWVLDPTDDEPAPQGPDAQRDASPGSSS